MSATAIRAGSSGDYATSRRGGLTQAEINMAEALRAGPRPVSFQNIAARFGRSVEDVRRHVDPKPSAPVAEASPAAIPVRAIEPWPFNKCAVEIEEAVRAAAEAHGVTLKAIGQRQATGMAMPQEIRLARQAVFYEAKRVSGFSSVGLADIFNRPPSVISEAVHAYMVRAGNDNLSLKAGRPTRTWTQGELATLKRYQGGEITKTRAAKIIGCDPGAVRRWAAGQGL